MKIPRTQVWLRGACSMVALAVALVLGFLWMQHRLDGVLEAALVVLSAGFAVLIAPTRDEWLDGARRSRLVNARALARLVRRRRALRRASSR